MDDVSKDEIAHGTALIDGGRGSRTGATHHGERSIRKGVVVECAPPELDIADRFDICVRVRDLSLSRRAGVFDWTADDGLDKSPGNRIIIQTDRQSVGLRRRAQFPR